MESGVEMETPRRELVVHFWTLVLLAKLAVLSLVGGTLLITFSPFRTAGMLLIAIGIAVGLRWTYLYRETQQSIDTPDHT